MKYLLKSTLIAAPALFALAACDAPPAEDPALENDNEMAVPSVEEPLDTMPMDDTAPVDGNLTGGEAPVADTTDPAYNAGTDTPPVDEDAATDTTEETTTTE